jgi:UDP-glucose 4-epimerase
MKILVTGGAGFIGSHVVDRYLDLGHRVVVVDNFVTGKKENLNSKARLYEVDIRDQKAVEEIFAQEKPEVLNHHAAQMDVRKSVADPIYDCQVNILGLLNLLEAGLKNNLRKVIFASSGGVVYGDAEKLPTPEDYDPKRPLSPYGVAKLTSENYLYFYFKNYNLPFVALRYANVYGPRQDPFGEAGVVAIFSQKLLKNEQPVINGDGKQTRDYVYVDDVVEANVLSLDKKINGPLNIGTAKETSVNEIFHLLQSLIKTGFSERHGPEKPGEQRRSALECSRAKILLDWRAKTSLKRGLAQTVDFFRKL